MGESLAQYGFVKNVIKLLIRMNLKKMNLKERDGESFYLESKGKLTKVSRRFIREVEINVILICVILFEAVYIIVSSV